MKECDWTERVQSAALRDALDATELEHVRDCADCRGMTEAIRLLRAEGRSAERFAVGRVPSARALYAQARPVLSGRNVRDVLRPIVWLELVTAGLAVLAVIVAASWLGTRGGTPSGLPSLGDLAEPSASAASAVSASMVVAVLVALTVAWYGLTGLGGTTRWR